MCRKCEDWHYERTYGQLRGHLRAIHRIPQLSDDDLWIYEAYAGSSCQDLQERRENRNRYRRPFRVENPVDEVPDGFSRMRPCLIENNPKYGEVHRNVHSSTRDRSRLNYQEIGDLREVITNSIQIGRCL